MSIVAPIAGGGKGCLRAESARSRDNEEYARAPRWFMPDQQWHPKANPWLIALAVIVPTFMEVLDTSIAAVALPNIAGNLSATIDEATWVLTSYLVANAIVLPASGWFALRFGRRRFLLFCIVVFTVSSFFCGAATSLWMILVARAVQGAGGGALQPLSQAILLESFPPQKRGAAMAIFALGVVVAPVLGPTLGGYLTDEYSWRWAFYINIPIGFLAVYMVSRFVEDPPYIKSAKPGRFDSIGLGLLVVWLGAMQIVLDKGQEDDWFAATWIRWAVTIAIAGFIAFLIHQFRDPHPIVNLRVFKDRNFALGCIVMTMFGGVIYGLVSILPLFYQTVMGYSARSAGLAVSPRGIGAICMMPVIAALTSKLDNRWLISTGFLAFAGTAIWMSHLSLEMSQWSLLIPIILSGSASGLVFVPLATTSMGTLRNEMIGNASGLYNLLRNVGGSVGISVVNTIVARRQQIHRAELARYISPGANFDSALGFFRGAVGQGTDSQIATSRAYALMDRGLNQQAVIYSYVDDLRYIAVVCLVCIPVVLLLKRVKPKGGAAAAAH
jgi:DHA2 family multidrug resistance protein